MGETLWVAEGPLWARLGRNWCMFLPRGPLSTLVFITGSSWFSFAARCRDCGDSGFSGTVPTAWEGADPGGDGGWPGGNAGLWGGSWVVSVLREPRSGWGKWCRMEAEAAGVRTKKSSGVNFTQDLHYSTRKE